MPENYTPAAAATGTWTEEEIRHQPRAWIRSLTNIDALRSALNNFLEPLLRKENLRVILTGAGTSAFIGDIIAPWLASHTDKNFSAVPTTMSAALYFTCKTATTAPTTAPESTPARTDSSTLEV